MFYYTSLHQHFYKQHLAEITQKISKAKQHLEAELSTKIQQKRQKQSSVLTRLYYYHKNENNNEVDHIKRPGRGHRHKHMY